MAVLYSFDTAQCQMVADPQIKFDLQNTCCQMIYDGPGQIMLADQLQYRIEDIEKLALSKKFRTYRWNRSHPKRPSRQAIFTASRFRKIKYKSISRASMLRSKADTHSTKNPPGSSRSRSAKSRLQSRNRACKKTLFENGSRLRYALPRWTFWPGSSFMPLPGMRGTRCVLAQRLSGPGR